MRVRGTARGRRTGQALAIIALTALVTAAPAWSSDREPRSAASALAAVDAALARDDVGAALRAWHVAAALARAERRWDGLVAVGDASLRIGTVARIHELPEAGARSAYVEALFRARQQRSLRARFVELGEQVRSGRRDATLAVHRDQSASGGEHARNRRERHNPRGRRPRRAR